MIKNAHLKPEITKMEKKLSNDKMHGQKTVRNIDDFHPTILVVILNMNGLDTQLKERILGWI